MNHPTVSGPQQALALLDKFIGAWQEPALGEVSTSLLQARTDTSGNGVWLATISVTDSCFCNYHQGFDRLIVLPDLPKTEGLTAPLLSSLLLKLEDSPPNPKKNKVAGNGRSVRTGMGR